MRRPMGRWEQTVLLSAAIGFWLLVAIAAGGTGACLEWADGGVCVGSR